MYQYDIINYTYSSPILLEINDERINLVWRQQNHSSKVDLLVLILSQHFYNALDPVYSTHLYH